MIIEIGQKVNRGYGYYSDQIECFNNPAHNVLWWHHGVFCLTERDYVKAKTKPFEEQIN